MFQGKIWSPLGGGIGFIRLVHPPLEGKGENVALMDPALAPAWKVPKQPSGQVPAGEK